VHNDVTEVSNITGVLEDEVTAEENTHNIEIDDDDISIENEEHDDNNHVSINDLSTIEQMNTAQINTDPETSDKIMPAG